MGARNRMINKMQGAEGMFVLFSRWENAGTKRPLEFC